MAESIAVFPGSIADCERSMRRTGEAEVENCGCGEGEASEIPARVSESRFRVAAIGGSLRLAQHPSSAASSSREGCDCRIECGAETGEQREIQLAQIEVWRA